MNDIRSTMRSEEGQRAVTETLAELLLKPTNELASAIATMLAARSLAQHGHVSTEDMIAYAPEFVRRYSEGPLLDVVKAKIEQSAEAVAAIFPRDL